MKNKFKISLIAAFSCCLLISFQNCGGKFKTTEFALPSLSQIDSFYKLEGKKILFNGIEIQIADLKTFKVLGPSMAKDENTVFCGELAVSNLQPSTISAIGTSYFKDSDKIFFSYFNNEPNTAPLCKFLENVDAESFKEIDPLLGHDKTKLFIGDVAYVDVDQVHISSLRKTSSGYRDKYRPLAAITNCSIPNTLTCLNTFINFVDEKNEPFQFFKSYEPKHKLWSDGALKKRYIYLPGSPINSDDESKWIFPSGTIAWKSFSIDDKKVELRSFKKDGETSWIPQSFIYDAQGLNPTEITEGDNIEIDTVTPSFTYKVPAITRCTVCHSSSNDNILGFNNYNLPTGSAEGSLSDLIKDNWLSNTETKEFEIPGNALDKSAIGYLAINCAVCHNEADGYNLTINQDATTTEELNAYTSTVGVDSSAPPLKLIKAGDETQSRIYLRINNGSMPPVEFHSQPDTEAAVNIKDWIKQL